MGKRGELQEPWEKEVVSLRAAVRDRLCWRSSQHPAHSLAHVQFPHIAPCQHLHVSMAWRRGTTVLLGLVGTSGQRQEGSTGWSLSLFLAVSRFVKYTGYGNAAGLLAARGLMAGGREEGEYSEDEDTDTEEYKEAKPK